jgi:phenylpropionate dioxygenase-like ring-hydroxylating dioxygenase large terminal subunit
MHYTRNDWYVACLEGDIAAAEPFAVTVLDERLVIWRSDARIAVLEDRCVHRAAALSLGRCEGAQLRCMYHGLLFDGDGRVVSIPGQDIIPPNAAVRSYPATARHGFIWVWMGDPAKACTDLLPTLFEGVDLGDFATRAGVMDFAADASLVSDNLLDFSHLPFVHANSFRSPPQWAQSKTKASRLDRGVRFERWIENGDGKFLYPRQAGETFDDWLCYDYLVPGVLLMWSAIFPAGTARAVNFARPDFGAAIGQVSTNIQTITPMTQCTSRYHFTVGLHRRLGDGESLIDKLATVTTQAFQEDRRMIEVQQEIIGRDPARPMMPTIHDRGVLIYNRLKNRLIAAENDR